MKKLIMFICGVFMIGFAWGARDCPTTTQITLDGNQNGKNGAFIYTKGSVRDTVIKCNEQKSKDGTKCFFSGGGVYECDNESGCRNNYVMFGQKGWVSGDGHDVEGKILKCNAGAFTTDQWIVNTPSVCDGQVEKNGKKINFENDKDAECYLMGNGNYCCVKKEIENKKCSLTKNPGLNLDVGKTKHGITYDVCRDVYEDKTTDINGSEFDVVCRDSAPTPKFVCKPTKCKEGYSLNTKQSICIQQTKTVVASAKKPEAKKTVSTQKQESAPAEAKQSTVVVVLPQPMKEKYSCGSLPKYDRECKKAGTLYEKLKSYCAGEPTKAGYDEYVAEIATAEAECKNVSSLNDKIKDYYAKINKKIAGWHDDLKVWKNKEGNFNTSRLASDSIAGVVLGTAGGLIVSNVVKKNQIKSGFEDVHCAIGGQKVADWHDEFTVGIR